MYWAEVGGVGWGGGGIFGGVGWGKEGEEEEEEEENVNVTFSFRSHRLPVSRVPISHQTLIITQNSFLPHDRKLTRIHMMLGHLPFHFHHRSSRS